MNDYEDNQIKILKTNTIKEMEKECTKLIKQGFELVGDIKIYYQNLIIDEDKNDKHDKNDKNKKYVYHQMLKYSKEQNLKQNYCWSDWE